MPNTNKTIEDMTNEEMEDFITKYLPVKNIEKAKYGEVFTPSALIKKIELTDDKNKLINFVKKLSIFFTIILVVAIHHNELQFSHEIFQNLPTIRQITYIPLDK